MTDSSEKIDLSYQNFNPPTGFYPAEFDWRSLWSIDPTLTFLNHGSFGACLLAVLERQRQVRDRIEQEPVRFFALELEVLAVGGLGRADAAKPRQGVSY
jgi:hypothetical protein